MEENNHIYPIFDKMLMRKDKEDLLKQHSVMVWFTGLSGSGKSTIAIALERELHKRGLLCRILSPGILVLQTSLQGKVPLVREKLKSYKRKAQNRFLLHLRQQK